MIPHNKDKSQEEDMLIDLFQQQRQLQWDLGYRITEMSLKERAAYIKEYALHTDHEMHEMLQELPYFKSWKQYPDEDSEAMQFAYARARKEMIDALHFFLNVCIGLGFDAEELHNMYMDKHKENYNRQQDKEHYKKCMEASTNEARK